MMFNHFLKYKEIVLVIALSIVAGLPLLQKGLHPTHDGEYHILRFYQFDKVLRDKVIFPRWAPDFNNGYGAPLFSYVYPLPNYAASLLHLLGISFIDAFKLQMFIALLLSGLLFYLWARIFWENLASAVGSIFYIFSPYHILDIYIRGSVGEVWALAFFPGLLWSIAMMWKQRGLIFIPVSAVLLSLIVFSHNILALMFLVFTFFYIVFLLFLTKSKILFAYQSILSIILGIGLSSVFWLPALWERSLVTGLEIFKPLENFPQLYQLIIPAWGSGFSAEGGNQMSFQIGIANIIAVAISIVVLIRTVILRQKVNQVSAFFLVVFFVVVFLMLEGSSSVWRIIPFLNYFQFPWRFLSIIILICSFLAGSIVFYSKQGFVRTLVAFSLIVFAVFSTIEYTKPAYYHQRDDNYYINRSNFIDGTNSPGNLFNTIWFSVGLIKKNVKFELIGAKGNIKEQATSAKYFAFLNLESSGRLLINTAYFPGWSASVNGKEYFLSPQKDGLMEINVPKGKSQVYVWFGDTPIRRISIYASMTFALLLTVSLVSILTVYARNHSIKL